MIDKSTLLDLVNVHGTPLIVIDHNLLKSNYLKFREHLPNVKPFYAIKANPESKIVSTLYNEGCGFDVASWEEFMIVYETIEGNNEDKKAFMNQNVIYANPVKRIDSLKKLNEYSIRMTYDNYIEVDKIAKYCKNSRLILRVDVP
ncbi:MAG: type III PLP-dependent enzyme, partial [Candidatus Hermodarchaeota archaeon]